VEERSTSKGFSGLRVLSLESRRAPEMAALITRHGGRAIAAPSMKEVPLESNAEALAFARELTEGRLDMVIFLTGVGTRALTRVVETRYSREQFAQALSRLKVVARGPKPAAALKELRAPVTVAVPEPNTWRDLLQALDERATLLPLQGSRVAVQEYGASNPELLAGLAQRGALVTRVPVYQWALPDDLGPLRAAVEAIARGEIDVVLFTTSVQVIHLLKVAEEMNLAEAVRRAFPRILVGSIGPVTSQELREHGLAVNIEPSHPKMGYLVSETARMAGDALRSSQGK
jgi:uroporphyrinogen-III synthase